MFFKKRTYLDYAAGAKGNPSSAHEEGRRSREQLEGARKDIATLTEVKPDDIIFTSGATEANAIAILGIGNCEGQTFTKKHALYLPSAHASIVENMKLLEERGVVVEPLPIKNGQVDCPALEKMIRPETVLVAMDAVCGETGTIWNTREVANVLRVAEKRFLAPSGLIGMSQPVASKSFFPSRALLHVDASQAPMTEKISRAHFSADTLVFDSVKVGGPRGVGCLIAHRTIPIAPLYRGGGQERGLRPGTENPEAARDFARALRTANENHDAFRAHSTSLRALLLKDLARLNLKNNASRFNLAINAGKEVAPHILNISLPGKDTDYLVALLDEAGFAVSTRSACETDSEEGSRAVFALTNDLERAKSTLRISWGPATSDRDLARFAAELVRQVAFIDSTASR